MTVTELIIKLAQMPPELEVVFDTTRPGETLFRLEKVDEIATIRTDTGEEFALLNPSRDNGNIEWEN
jgi:hypothetical protein